MAIAYQHTVDTRILKDMHLCLVEAKLRKTGRSLADNFKYEPASLPSS